MADEAEVLAAKVREVEGDRSSFIGFKVKYSQAELAAMIRAYGEACAEDMRKRAAKKGYEVARAAAGIGYLVMDAISALPLKKEPGDAV